MASSSDDYWHSILKKDGITSKGKRVRFHTTPPGKAQLISVGKKRPVDVDTQMVCKSYSKAKKKRRRQKEPAWKDTELKNSEDGLVTTTTTTTAQEYEVEAILDHKKVFYRAIIGCQAYLASHCVAMLSLSCGPKATPIWPWPLVLYLVLCSMMMITCTC